MAFALPVNPNSFKTGCWPLRMLYLPLGGGEGYRWSVSNHCLFRAAQNGLGGRGQWGTTVHSNVLVLTQHPSTQMSIFFMDVGLLLVAFS